MNVHGLPWLHGQDGPDTEENEMGDRCNVVITDRSAKDMTQHGAVTLPGSVCLYSHWGGEEIVNTTKEGMSKGRGRWNDPSYLARILFANMIRSDIDSETGFGIYAGCFGDGDNNVIVIDTAERTVKHFNRGKVKAWGSFEEFVAA